MAETEEIKTITDEIGDKCSLKASKEEEEEKESYEDCDNVLRTDSDHLQTDTSEPMSNDDDDMKIKSKLDKAKGESDEEYYSLGEEEDDDEEEEEEEEKEADKIKEEENRKLLEETLSDDEKLERKNKSQEIKDDGNKLFRECEFKEAVEKYTEALLICPYSFPKERAIMFSNRGACHMKLEADKKAITDCSKAVELHPHYLKALLRRAELYEKTDKLDEALADYQKAVELDPSQSNARISAMKLGDQIKDRNEKMKTEMMGKLKDLGNLVLRPFGLSTENFQLQQQDGGGYSVNFKQN